MAAKKVLSIVKFNPASLQSSIQDVFHTLSEVLSQELVKPETLAQVMSVVRDMKDVLEKGVEKVAKQRIIELLKEQGEQTTDKGARVFRTDGWELSMRPYRTGFDPKKLEALVRAKGKDPSNYMHAKITYEVSEDGCKKLVDKKVFTFDELETCRYDESWTVQTPTHTGT